MRTLVTNIFVLFILVTAVPAFANDFCVDDLSDGPANGANCAATCDGTDDCSLRDAIAAANANAGVTDVINIGVTGTITLNQGTGLNINDDIEIYGPGQSQLTIDANGASRVFTVIFANTEIYSVTVTGGSDVFGAGIAVSVGSLELTDMTLTGNNATQFGGGLHCEMADCILRNITVSNNSSTLHGGGVYATNGATLTAYNSTISGNTAQLGGGLGLNGDTMTLNNVTVSGNQATSHGGGILVNLGTVSLNNGTITNNTADSDDTDDGDGGGVYLSAAGSGLAQNSILAGNIDATTAGDVHPDCSGPGGTTSAGYNIVGVATGCTGTEGPGDQAGDAANPLDPRLSALADNTGLTLTHSPLPGSPAIDNGNPDGCLDGEGADLGVDQREFDREVDADGDGVARCDSGAYEIRLFTVDTIEANFFGDLAHGNGICFSAANNGCTLRAAIQETNALPGTDAINFSITGTMLPISSLGDITEGLIISGPGADLLTLDGNDHIQALKMDSPGDDQGLSISGLTISGAQLGVFVRNGDDLMLDSVVIEDNSSGGVLTQNNAEVYIVDSVIQNNSRSSGGGGLYFGSGELTIQRSLFAGNSATSPVSGAAGGIAINSGTARIVNSTITNNEATTFGGGISTSTANITIINSTISDNLADSDNDMVGSAGGIANGSGTVDIKNSILANNKSHTGPDEKDENCGGTIGSLGNNIEDGSSCVFSDPSDLSDTDPLLGPLADNGGTMFSIALLEGSPAIDAISGSCKDESDNGVTLDQRSFSRPSNVDCDIGAFEVGTCGDGVIDAGEACDDGAGNNSDTVADACRTDCSEASCGDGVTDSGESCDDGNDTDGDGCSSSCEVEAAASDDDSSSSNDNQSGTTTNDPSDAVDDSTDDTTDDTTTTPASGGCSLVRR